MLKEFTHIARVSGVLSSPFQGDYVNSGVWDGRPYFFNASVPSYLWYSAGDDHYYITDTLGFITGDTWTKPADSLSGDYLPLPLATGIATVVMEP